MNIKTKSIASISNHKYARCDYKYWKIKDAISFNQFFRLKDLFYVINGSVQTENYTNEISNIPYIRIGNIDYKFGISKEDMIYLFEDTEIAENKVLRENDLVLATIGATVGKTGRANTCKGGTHSNNTVVLRAKKDTLDVQFYEKLFQSDFYINYIFGVVAQKAQPNLQDYEIKNLLIPVINKTYIKQVVKDIEPISAEIARLQKTVKDSKTIIDEAFQKCFGFDYDAFERLKKIKIFDTKVTDYSNNPDLRFSAKFHRTAGEFVKQELAKITDKKIKHFLAEPIVLGASVSPSDFDEVGDTYYISMASTKNYMIELDDAQLLNRSYVNAHLDKKVKKNDIIMNRSGVAIGKVALVDQDIDGIFADFTMRIRFSNYNPLFGYYYMRSKYFQYLIEIYKKGLQNQNIFPIVVREFPLPDISLDEQKRIVNEIQVEINKQSQIKNKIADLRKEIDIIVEKSLKEE